MAYYFWRATCTSNDVALELIEAGVTDRMHALDKPISIQFSQEREDSVIGIIKGSGLIDDIYVVNNELPVMLISNTSLVEKVIFVQDKTPD
jgi:hypothetical protein